MNRLIKKLRRGVPRSVFQTLRNRPSQAASELEQYSQSMREASGKLVEAQRIITGLVVGATFGDLEAATKWIQREVIAP